MKGGTGKTTIAYNMAERAWNAGFEVTLLDCDPQESCVCVFHARNGKPGWDMGKGLVSVHGASEVTRLAQDQRLVICDLPAVDRSLLRRFLSVMDLILSPVGPGPTDMLSAIDFNDSVAGLGVPVYSVANMIPPGVYWRDVVLETMAERSVSVAPPILYRRVAHMRAFFSGLGVCEYQPESQAALEADALWQWAAGCLGLTPAHSENGKSL